MNKQLLIGHTKAKDCKFTPSGNIPDKNVQGAIETLDAAVADLDTPLSDINRVESTAGGTTYTIDYTVGAGNVTVRVDGFTLAPSDYTATNGTTVVLDTTVAAGVLVDITGLESNIIVGTVVASAVSYENLDANGDVGTGAEQVAIGDHEHSGTYEPADNTILKDADIGTSVGYHNIPQNSKSAAYTCVLGDQGKHILHPSADTTARTFTIPANASVAYDIGTALTFINQDGGGEITITITSDTMRLAVDGTTGSRTLAENGIATAIKLTATEWIISGPGLT